VIQIFVEYAWLIILMPVFGLIISLFLGRYLPKFLKEGGVLVVFTLGISFVLSLLVFLEFHGVIGDFGKEHYEASRTWLGLGDTFGGADIEMGILVDGLSSLMLLLVSTLCLLISIYSLGYMEHEEGLPRYYAEFALFTIGMLGTVASNNFLMLLIFWEIMGLCSYLLIGFWYHKPSAASAAKKAFLVTRVGDVFFLAGVVVVFVKFGTLNFLELQHLAEEGIGAAGAVISGSTFTIISLLLFGGAIGKSAQFPLHVWLPDAMEGPTTVSALIHAATMVKGGVFLVARSFPFLTNSGDAAVFVAVIGGMTAIIAASMALVSTDIKKVLAYSTISQLGYMILGLGAGAFMVYKGHVALGYTAALFHLMNHAFFKALLFLCSGSVIHGCGTQDLREMGGLKKYMPITSITMLIGCLSIAGFPLLSGFWSKDEVLASVFEAGDFHSIFFLLWLLGIITAFMTAFYMFRLWFMAFSGKPRGYKHAHESPPTMTYPLIILAGLALISGILAVGLGGLSKFLEFGGHHLEGHHTTGAIEIFEHTFTSPLTYISIGLGLAGIFFAYSIYYKAPKKAEAFTATPGRKKMHHFLTNRLYLNDAYIDFAQDVGHGTIATGSNWVDKNIIDGAVNGAANGTVESGRWYRWFDEKIVDGTVNLISRASIRAGAFFRRGQTGNVTDYAGFIVIGIILLLIFIQFKSDIWELLVDLMGNTMFGRGSV